MMTFRAGAMAGKVEQPCPVVNLQSLSRHQGKLATWTKFEAPLASLDCSITEPIDALKPHKILETPTLTSYLDYDELSDMIDDSLMEIANKGCLSKTTFAPAVDSKVRQLMVSSKVVKSSAQCSGSPPDSRLVVELPLKAASQANVVNQNPLMAGHQVYDYSSTSRVPSLACQTRVGAARKELSTTSADIKKTGKVKGDGTASSRKTRSVPDVSKSADLASGQQTRKEQKKRFTFNLFNFFSGTTGVVHQKPVRDCHKDDLVNEQPADQSKNQTGSAKVRVSVSSSARVRASSSKACSEIGSRPRDSIKLTNQRRRRKAINNSNSLADAQTNCAHDNGNNIRPSNSVSDFRLTGQLSSAAGKATAGAKSALAGQVDCSTGELLLDLSRRSHIGASVGVCQRGERGLLEEPAASRLITVRQTKSVKFTTLPDRVVMVSPANNVSGGGSHHLRHHHNHHYHRSPRARLNCSARVHLGSLPRSLNPIEQSARAGEPLPVPIIKRAKSTRRKLSSTYSQTDSSKNLNELLARYEADSELVEAINERLKLADTIVSSKSALDEKEASLTGASQLAACADLQSSSGECEVGLRNRKHTACDSNLDKCWHGATSSTDEPTSGQSVKRSTFGFEPTVPTEHQQHVNAHIKGDPIPEPAAPMNPPLPSSPSLSRVNHRTIYSQTLSALDTIDPDLVVADECTKNQQRPFV